MSQQSATELGSMVLDNNQVTNNTANTTHKNNTNNTPNAPDNQLSIHFHNLSSSLRLPTSDRKIPHLYSPITNTVGRIVSCGKDKVDFLRIQRASGVIKPNSMTLVVSGPGCGKSSYLRLLANRLPADAENTLLYNSLTPQETKSKSSVDIRKMVRYMDQVDTLLPLLTVSETLHFASKVNSVNYSSERVDEVIKQLGLEECRDTVIGNHLIRGVSGGQKKRVSLGELLVTDAALLCLDQYTDGLDSATALEITQTLKRWCESTNGAIVATLQQPGPEITALFDHIVVLREGNVIYDGSRNDLASYFRGMGFVQPSDVDLIDFLINTLVAPDIVHQQSIIEIQRQQGHDVKSFQVALGSKAKAAQRLTISEQNRVHNDAGFQTITTIQEDKTDEESSNTNSRTNSFGPPSGTSNMPPSTAGNMPGSTNIANSQSGLPKDVTSSVGNANQVKQCDGETVKTSLGPIDMASEPCLTTIKMLNYYHQSPFYINLMNELRPVFPKGQFPLSISNTTQPSLAYQHTSLTPTDNAKLKFSSKITGHSKILPVFARELRVLARSRTLFIPRFINGLIMSLLYGGLYYQVKEADFYLRISALLIGLTQTALATRSEVPVFFEHNQIALRQISHGYYPSWVFIIASLVRSFPMCFAETIVFTFILYFMSNHSLYAWTFVVYFLVLLTQSINLSVLFKFITSLSPSVEAAQSNAQLIINLFMVFGGFFIGRSSVIAPMLPFYWGSVFSWANRALAINEFTSPRYDQVVAYLDPKSQVVQYLPVGIIYLKQADMFTSRWWILWGFVYLIGLTFVFILLHSALLSSSYYLEGARGTRRSQDELVTWDEPLCDEDEDPNDDRFVEYESDGLINALSSPDIAQDQSEYNPIQPISTGQMMPAPSHKHSQPPPPPPFLHRSTQSPSGHRLPPPPPQFTKKDQEFEQQIMNDTQLAVIRNLQRQGTLSTQQSLQLQRQLVSPPPFNPHGGSGTPEAQAAGGSIDLLRRSVINPRHSVLLSHRESATSRDSHEEYVDDTAALPTLNQHLPFAPTWLSFDNIQYSVKVKDQTTGATVNKTLLNGVSGYARPSELLALVGSSGAGKTTLLDLLSFRKTTGTMTGSILLNGQIPTRQQISLVTGYVEQFDTLFAYQTVYETLLFVAMLKLPRDLTHQVRCQIVDEVLDILELSDIRDRLIGNSKIPGLSSSQLKRVNIGVELVGNPSVLFLDEPTTGLHASAAMSVIRICKKISQSGRAVVCTIHQPSTHILYHFDSLVLLGAGGHQIFFGELGYRCARLIQYLSRCPFIEPIKPQTNPAVWLINETGAFNSSVGALVSYEHFESQYPLEVEEFAKLLTNSGDPQPTEQILLSSSLLIRTLHKCYTNSVFYSRLQQRLALLSSIVVDIAMDGEKLNKAQASPRIGATAPAPQDNVPTPPLQLSPAQSSIERSNSSGSTGGGPKQQRFAPRKSVLAVASVPRTFHHNNSDHDDDDDDDDEDIPARPPGNPPPNVAFEKKRAKRMSITTTINPNRLRRQSTDLVHSASSSRVDGPESLPHNPSNLAVAPTQPAIPSEQQQQNHLVDQQPIDQTTPETQRNATCCRQFFVLWKRNHSSYWRNPAFLFVRLVTCFILSILFGLIYLRPDETTFSGVISRLSSVCVVIYFSSTCHSASIPAFESRVVFYRERASAYYSPILWSFVGFLNEAFWAIWGTLITVFFFYFLIQLPLNAANWFSYYLTCYIVVLCYSSTSLMIAAISPTQAFCNILNGAFLGLSFLFCGLTVTIPQAAAGWKWLFYMLPLSHGVEMAIQLFKDNTTLVNILDSSNQLVQIPVNQFISQYLGMTYDDYWIQFGWLCLYLFVTQLIATLATTFLVFQKR